MSAVLTGLVACNQTLNIMLTHQLCQGAVEDRERLALALENTAVVLSPLIPWSIACAVPLGAVSAPQGCVLTACYLYLRPLVLGGNGGGNAQAQAKAGCFPPGGIRPVKPLEKMA